MSQVRTMKNYDFFECSSAFQKSIRRGDEKTALYFMTELYLSGYDEYLWKRIKIITSEDVGLASPSMPSIIHSLYQMYNEQKVKSKGAKRPERLFLVQAVVSLCRCPKSRLIDWYVIKLFREHNDINLEVPDYAFDMHSVRGKILKRGLDHFYEEGSQLNNHKLQDLENEVKADARKVHHKEVIEPQKTGQQTLF